MQSAAAIAVARDAGDVSSRTLIARLTPAEVPALYLVALAVLAGDAAGYLRIGLPLWLAALFAAGALAALLLARDAWALVISLGAIATGGAVAAQSVYAPLLANATITAFSDNQPIVFEGTLERDPEAVGDVIRLYVRVERAGISDGALAAATGGIRVTVLAPDRYRIGDRLRIHSHIRFPRNYGDPGEFDYEAYMARERIAATALVSHPDQIQRIGYRRPWFWGSIEAIRERIGAFIDSGLDYPERAEMRALIIGDRGGIDPRLRDVFALTGMAHMLVISGLHLGFVASVAFVLMRLCCVPFPRLMILGYANKLAAITSGIAVLAYAAIAGTHVSTLRALIMVLCYVGAVLADRGREIVASLALAALIICFALPGSSMDIGFQLSFVAVLGIVLGMGRYRAWWELTRDRVVGTRGEIVYLAGGAVHRLCGGFVFRFGRDCAADRLLFQSVLAGRINRQPRGRSGDGAGWNDARFVCGRTQFCLPPGRRCHAALGWIGAESGKPSGRCVCSAARRLGADLHPQPVRAGSDLRSVGAVVVRTDRRSTSPGCSLPARIGDRACRYRGKKHWRRCSWPR